MKNFKEYFFNKLNESNILFDYDKIIKKLLKNKKLLDIVKKDYRYNDSIKNSHPNLLSDIKTSLGLYSVRETFEWINKNNFLNKLFNSYNFFKTNEQQVILGNNNYYIGGNFYFKKNNMGKSEFEQLFFSSSPNPFLMMGRKLRSGVTIKEEDNYFIISVPRLIMVSSEYYNIVKDELIK